MVVFPFYNPKNPFPVSTSLFSVSMWRTDCRRDAVPWTPRPALALVWSRPTFLTASGGSPSSTGPTRTLTFHPKVHPGTPPLPVICKFRCTSVRRHDIIIYLISLVLINSKLGFGVISFFFYIFFWGWLVRLLTSRYYFPSAQGNSRSLCAST